VKILVVDDHILFREGLVGMLTNHPDISVVGEAATVRGAIEKTLELNPDVVLLDISLPDGSGIDALREILTHRPNTKVVMLTIHDAEDLMVIAIRNGAVGYILKNIPVSKLIKILHSVEKGEAALSRKMTSRIVEEFSKVGKTQEPDNNGARSLTMRELEILKILGTGATNQEIAERLVISENTVKVHVHNILEKLDLRNRREAGQFARQYDFGLPPTPVLHRNDK
jgi:DNA-binding NarL/FixJ family response regulator